MAVKLIQTNIFIVNLLPRITYIILKTNLIVCYLKKEFLLIFSCCILMQDAYKKNKDHLSLYLSTLKQNVELLLLLRRGQVKTLKHCFQFQVITVCLKIGSKTGAVALHCLLVIHLTLLNVKI